LGFLLFALYGIPVSGAAFIFPPAMLSEIAIEISNETGGQIEGILFGIQGFFLKLAFMVSIAVLPVILVSGGGISLVDVFLKIPEKPEIKGIYNTTVFASAFFILSFIFYFKYREKSYNINLKKQPEPAKIIT
jgi:GPH family glycoside/pentoside/hexuronide:cation symporter